jgi:hypothetical protein
MEMNFPPTDREILTDISAVEKKISNLIELRNLVKIKNVQIIFQATNLDGSDRFGQIDQSNVPFNLPGELSNLLDDSLDHYTRLRQTLFSFLKRNTNEN